MNAVELSFDNAHDFFFAHDKKFLTVNLDGLARVLAEQNAITDLDVEGDKTTGFVALARTDGKHFTLVGLFTGGFRKNEAEGSGRFDVETLHNNAVMQRTNLHLCAPNKNWTV